jgi:hypothetical protein
MLNVTKNLAWLAALAGVVSALLGGCGGDEDGAFTASKKCTPNAHECVSLTEARVCPADGSAWQAAACPTGEECDQTTGTCGSAGPCTPDAHECVSETVARLCPNEPDAMWVTIACNSGETCDTTTGTCGGGCEPGKKGCATTKIAKVCASDGSGYVPFACANDEICNATTGDCEVDLLGGVCEPGTAKCQGGLKSLVCHGGGTGYDVTDCPTEAPCRDGLCTGPVCSIGESFCETSSSSTAPTISPRIRTCVGGTEWKYTDCPADQVCAQRTDNDQTTASCVKRICNPSDSACGDPSDATVDTGTYYSRCTLLTDGTYDWVKFACSATESCDPTLVISSSSTQVVGCTKKCTTGAQRCTNNGLSYQECSVDGEWGPTIDCNTDASEPMRLCEPKPGLISGDLATIVCADPVCRYIQTSTTTKEGGTCDGTKVRLCDDLGRLAPQSASVACETGICQSVSTTSYGGYLPGQCKDDCKEGDERCVGSATPLFQTCLNGVWNPATQRCPNSEICWGYVQDGVQKKLCGAECTPGSRKCEGTYIATCDDTGHWGTAQICDLGTCKTSAQTTGTVTACTVDCVPGTKVCSGTTKLASDGISIGKTSEQTCTAEGTLATAVVCSGTMTCRTTRTGINIGCIECLGPNAPGGNAMGLPDSRCSTLTTENDSLQICSSTNDWSSPLLCATGETCKLANTTGSCSSCTIGTTALPCTQTNIQAFYGTSTTCLSFTGYSAGACGIYSDCCALSGTVIGGYCSTSTVTNSAAFCGP